MVQRIEVQLVDDLDGESIAERTHTFVVDGVQYEIDLNGENTEAFFGVLEPYMSAARRVGGKRQARKVRVQAKKTATPAPVEVAAEGDKPADSVVIRAWALESGLNVAPRGRIPQSVVDAYRAWNEGS